MIESCKSIWVVNKIMSAGLLEINNNKMERFMERSD